jgi:DNA invertase Pin-like site-specific DNA recombinase
MARFRRCTFRRAQAQAYPPYVTMHAAIYARVSTTDQTCENQLLELRRYCAARGWAVAEYVDTGVSGAKERRPALDQLMTDARQRRIDAIVVWRLDRFGRNLRHRVTTIEELAAAGVAFVSMGESIDTSSPTRRLMRGIFGSFAQFERERIEERIHAGLQRARTQGKRLGRPRRRPAHVPAPGGNVRAAAAEWGVSKSTAARWIPEGRKG